LVLKNKKKKMKSEVVDFNNVYDLFGDDSDFLLQPNFGFIEQTIAADTEKNSILTSTNQDEDDAGEAVTNKHMEEENVERIMGRRRKRMGTQIIQTVKKVRYELKIPTENQIDCLENMAKFEKQVLTVKEDAPIIYGQFKDNFTGILADPPGAGKTYTMAYFINLFKEQIPRTLVICSKMLVVAWERELKSVDLKVHTIEGHTVKDNWKKVVADAIEDQQNWDVLLVVPGALEWFSNFHIDRLVIDDIQGVKFVHLENVVSTFKWIINAAPKSKDTFLKKTSLMRKFTQKPHIVISDVSTRNFNYDLTEFEVPFYDHINAVLIKLKRIPQYALDSLNCDFRDFKNNSLYDWLLSSNDYEDNTRLSIGDIKQIFNDVVLKSNCLKCKNILQNIHVELNCHQLYCGNCTSDDICSHCNNQTSFYKLPIKHCPRGFCIEKYKSQKQALKEMIEKIAFTHEENPRKIIIITKTNINDTIDHFNDNFKIYNVTKLTSTSIQYCVDAFNNDDENSIFVVNSCTSLNFPRATHIINYDVFNTEDKQKYREQMLGRALCLSRKPGLPLSVYNFVVKKLI
jgi:hypothetical protein